MTKKITQNNKRNRDLSHKKDLENEKQTYLQKYVHKESPFVTANFFQRIFFTWVNPILNVSSKQPFQEDMLYSVPKDKSSEVEIVFFRENMQSLLEEYKDKIEETKYCEESKKPNILFKACVKTFKKDIFRCLIMSLVFSIVAYFSAGLLYWTLHAFDAKNEEGNSQIEWTRVFMLLAAIVVTRILNTLLNANLWFIMDNLIGVKLVNILKCLILEKSLDKAISREKQFSTGEILNLTNSDINKVETLAWNILNIITVPFEIVIGLILLGILTGYAIFPTTLVVIATMLVSKKFAKISMKLQKKKQKYGDELLKEIWGCYGNIRFVKMEALENFFLYKIFNIKLKQLGIFAKRFLFDHLLYVVNNSFAILLLVSLFGFYMYFGNVLTVSSVFTILQIFQRFKDKINQSSDLLNSVTESWVSVLRLNTFFVSEEIDFSIINYYDKQKELPQNLENQDEKSNQEYSIEIKNGNFYWVDKKQVKYLEEIDALEKMKKDKKCCMSMKKVQKKKENHKN